MLFSRGFDMNNLLSVIIPVYNVEKYLSRCVNSVLSQTFSDFELILVDDGSPDNCPKLCDEYAKKDSRIKVIHKQNRGLSSARNAGLKICKGDYIFFIDSDDYLAYEYVLSDFMHKAQSEDADFVYSLMNCATDTKISEMKCCKRFVKDNRLFFLSNPYFFSACNKLYKRTLLQFIQFVPGRINEDVDVIPLVFCHAKKITKLDRPTYNYYQNQASITRSAFSEKRFDMFKSVSHAYQEFVGTEYEKSVFYENIFGFQIFSVCIEILKKTFGTKRKNYLIKFCSLLKDYHFDNFFHYAFCCFVHNENFSKRIKKLAALAYLKIFCEMNKSHFGEEKI